MQPDPQHRAGQDVRAMWIQHQMGAVVSTTSQKHNWAAAATAYAMWSGNLLALSMIGAGTAVDAIRANVSMGKLLTIGFENGSRNDISQHSVSTKDNRYTLFKTRLPLLRKDHYILLNNLLIQPQLDEEFVYVMGRWDEAESAIIGRGLRQYVPVAVLPQWYDWLVTENKKLTGYRTQVQAVTGAGFRIFCIPLQLCNWGELVKAGLESGALQFEVQHGTR